MQRKGRFGGWIDGVAAGKTEMLGALVRAHSLLSSALAKLSHSDLNWMTPGEWGNQWGDYTARSLNKYEAPNDNST